ncbi:ras-associated and pleckstrin homology domains-containing protein 1-like [Eriocheir sinensis]|uniref:ras-associated and pleckstrin homology domains-containing protein 1-like n=1 Tax=Eriocheir sinensis TaxID=95602 RepID=UPI0021C876F7|nr:ras-associated and pleckstrin homology domains-containing protein 1-like [Eriocheir sinensis]
MVMSLPDAATCHHCHIHAPIPAEALKRTHPLRSGSVECEGGGLTSSFRKNVSFLYRKLHGVSLVTSPPPPPPLPPLKGSTPSRSILTHSNASTLPPSLPRSSPDSSRHSSQHSSPRPSSDLRPALVIDSQPPEPPPHRRPLPPLPKEAPKRRGFSGLQAVLLVGAYALLLVLAIVVGVVLTQEGQRRPPRPIGGGAPLPVRVVRPRPRPQPQDLDFVDIEPNPLQGPPRNAPPPQPRPAPPPPPPPVRRPTFSALDTDFNLAPQQEDPRGRKEPEIKILKSWNNKNADGTLSWGYISEDGSFKNETRGHDCVVRGVYGYVEQETGKLLSFPYVSGNPCDPNEPDYYDYYDDFVPNEPARGRSG